MKKRISSIQLGKQRITENFLDSLKNHFKNSEIIRISVLKSARKDKSQVKEFSEEILEKLGKNYTAKIIGFVIVLKKWRKPRR